MKLNVGDYLKSRKTGLVYTVMQMNHGMVRLLQPNNSIILKDIRDVEARMYLVRYDPVKGWVKRPESLFDRSFVISEELLPELKNVCDSNPGVIVKDDHAYDSLRYPTMVEGDWKGLVGSMKSTLRKTTEAPKNLSKKRMLKELGVAKVTFKGNRCIVLLENTYDSTYSHRVYFVGKSDCSPEDKFDPVRGFKIAYSRAVAKREMRRHQKVMSENIKKMYAEIGGDGTYEV